MKNLHFRVAVFVFITAILSISAFAQTDKNKVYVIDTGAFANEKQGIKKFTNASKRLAEELKPKYTELGDLAKNFQSEASKYQKLKEGYEKNPNGPIPFESVQKKGEEVEKMQVEYKRKEEDLKRAIAKREQELLNPIRVDIYKAMSKFAKDKGYPIILDLVKMVETNLILAIGDSKVDLTKEFIQYYNALPATAAK